MMDASNNEMVVDSEEAPKMELDESIVDCFGHEAPKETSKPCRKTLDMKVIDDERKGDDDDYNDEMKRDDDDYVEMKEDDHDKIMSQQLKQNYISSNIGVSNEDKFDSSNGMSPLCCESLCKTAKITPPIAMLPEEEKSIEMREGALESHGEVSQERMSLTLQKFEDISADSEVRQQTNLNFEKHGNNSSPPMTQEESLVAPNMEVVANLLSFTMSDEATLINMHKNEKDIPIEIQPEGTSASDKMLNKTLHGCGLQEEKLEIAKDVSDKIDLNEQQMTYGMPEKTPDLSDKMLPDKALDENQTVKTLSPGDDILVEEPSDDGMLMKTTLPFSMPSSGFEQFGSLSSQMHEENGKAREEMLKEVTSSNGMSALKGEKLEINKDVLDEIDLNKQEHMTHVMPEKTTDLSCKMLPDKALDESQTVKTMSAGGDILVEKPDGMLTNATLPFSMPSTGFEQFGSLSSQMHEENGKAREEMLQEDTSTVETTVDEEGEGKLHGTKSEETKDKSQDENDNSNNNNDEDEEDAGADTSQQTAKLLFLKMNHGSGQPRGLRNTGNTCYMNSMLQCLAACFVGIDEPLPMVEHSTSLAHYFFEIVWLIHAKGERKIPIQEFKQMMGKVSVKYKSCGQQDAFQFLMCLLKNVETELKSHSLDIIADLFSCQRTIKMTCFNCQHEIKFSQTEYSLILSLGSDQGPPQVQKTSSWTRMPFLLLDAWRALKTKLISLNIMKNKGLETYVEKLMRAEEDYEVFCPKCSGSKKGSIISLMTSLPKILIIYINRFDFNQRNKSNEKVTFETDDFKLKTSDGETATYRAVAFCEHFGSFEYGHYLARVRSRRGDLWFTCNDGTVKNWGHRDGFIISEHVYAIFYKREETKMSTQV